MACLMRRTYCHIFRGTTYEYKQILLPGRTHSGVILFRTPLHSSETQEHTGMSASSVQSTHEVCVLLGRIRLDCAGEKIMHLLL